MLGHKFFSLEIEDEVNNIKCGIHVQSKNLSMYSIHIIKTLKEIVNIEHTFTNALGIDEKVASHSF
jgi:hypothetical protein